MIKPLVLISNLVSQRKLNKIIFGNILLLFVFALIYYFMFIYNNIDHFFIPENESHSFVNALYFSLVTQSTLGYGDIYPISNVSKIVVMVHVFIMLIILML